jgi:hypothetical protein
VAPESVLKRHHKGRLVAVLAQEATWEIAVKDQKGYDGTPKRLPRKTS